MKRNSMLIVASTLIVMASACSLEITPTLSENEKNVKTVDITIVANDKPAIEAEAATKTYIDGTAIKWSDSGEMLKVWEVATPTEGELVTSSKVSSEGVTEDSGSTMSFAVSMEDKSSGYTNFDYYAVYPSSAYQTGSVVTSIALNTTAAQTPSSTNFDPSHDLLIAKKIANGGSQASGLSMQFARVVAIGKMNVKNLGSSEDITKITFSAKVGDTPVAIAGRTTFDLNTAKPTTEYGSNTKDYSIILNYEGQGIKANTAEGMVAYFTCYPFAINSETPGSFKVVVETATKTFTKEVSVSSAKGLAFTIGKASVFSVDMDGIEGQNKAVDLCYAYLVPSDVELTNSYSNKSVAKSHGDCWTMFAISSDGCIGVRRNDDGQNDSYIKLPDFANNIKTVVVTLKSPVSGKTISLETSATSTSGSVADLATTAATIYTFDLSSGPNVKTAYFRASGARALVEKVEVFTGTDTRSSINAPESVTAALNNEDANVTNSIDVSWSSVSGAGNYVITLVPDSGDDVVIKAATSPYTVTDLNYEMTYSVSVQAEPADYYLNTISAKTSYAGTVTTGAEPTGSIALRDSDITSGANTVQGTNNSKLAYRLGSSSNDGSITFDAGYSSITFTLAGWASGTRSFSISNGKINSSSSLSPEAGTPSGTISSGFSTSFSGTEYTIIVDDPNDEVVFSGRRAVVWGFTAVKYVAPAVAAPTFSVAEGTYNETKSVAISCATDGAIIHYTTDGSIPTSSSPTYSSAISVNVSMTIKAIAIKASDESTIASATYNLKVLAPTFSPDEGSYGSAQSITISCATDGATIHYTTDGTVPTSSSPTYSSAIPVSASQTIKAIAIKDGWTNSDVASASYVIGSGDPIYRKVTSLTSGKKYILVQIYSGTPYVMNPTTISSSQFAGVNASSLISDDAIASNSTTNDYAVTITTSGSQCTIMNKDNKYIGVAQNVSLNDSSTLVYFYADGGKYSFQTTSTKNGGRGIVYRSGYNFKSYAMSNAGNSGYSDGYFVLYEYRE